jgi:tetratricopeptide (TPR) repeat protein
LHADADRPEEVARAAALGLAIAPSDPFLLYIRGLALVELERSDEAVDALRAAAANGSRARDIWVYIGHAEDKAGRIDAALAAYDRAIVELVDDPRPEAAAAWMLYRADRCAEARGYLENLGKRGYGNEPRLLEAATACRTR